MVFFSAAGSLESYPFHPYSKHIQPHIQTLSWESVYIYFLKNFYRLLAEFECWNERMGCFIQVILSQDLTGRISPAVGRDPFVDMFILKDCEKSHVVCRKPIS